MGDKEAPRLVVPPATDAVLNLRSEIGAPTKRKKVPLKPGHSLADWIRISRENPGIANVIREKDPEEPVVLEELSLHNSLDDCWLALRGDVFNVTPYLSFHPGGPEEILRVSGQDATEAFNEIHAWVNYKTLLKACYVAPFDGASSKSRPKWSPPSSRFLDKPK